MKTVGEMRYAIIPVLGFRGNASKNYKDSSAQTNWISITKLNKRVSEALSKDGLMHLIVKLEDEHDEREAIAELQEKHNEGIIMDKDNRELKSYTSVTTERDLNGVLGYL